MDMDSRVPRKWKIAPRAAFAPAAGVGLTFHGDVHQTRHTATPFKGERHLLVFFANKAALDPPMYHDPCTCTRSRSPKFARLLTQRGQLRPGALGAQQQSMCSGKSAHWCYRLALLLFSLVWY
jgi:hypothetical protein